ncbi:HRDC domain-containing protein [Actinomyces lilanjuaniae]|uniref:HRDC domain-containing protein n=1 Tax=Actinomyces lilanjuaniae TaxID=2321394 RepID=UPI001FAA66EC|nr:HRDC domain-containing protein [Actinomyces lilanjuaniae]
MPCPPVPAAVPRQEGAVAAPRPAVVPGTTDHPVPPEHVVAYPRPRDGLPAVTDSPAALAAAAHALATTGTGPVAVDAERASGFRYGQDAYLIQLRRDGVGTVLVDPLSAGSLTTLAQAMSQPNWVLHAADQDLPCLHALGLYPPGLFDTELAARLLGRDRVGLGPLIEDTLGLRLSKDHAAADWSIRPLPPSWLVYAALDVEHLLDLHQALGEELERAGKAQWAAQEFEHLRTRAPRQTRPDPWRRVPHAGKASRSPRSLAVLRELWTAREELAAELDLSPSKVLPHQALVAAAVYRPTSRRKMGSLREFSSRQARQHQERWWRAIERALTLPDADLPPTRAPLGPGELPRPRSWRRHHPEAATALEQVRQALHARSTAVRVPQELLLAPEAQRRIAWDIGEERHDHLRRQISTAEVCQRLEAAGARPWQVEQTAAAIATSLSR